MTTQKGVIRRRRELITERGGCCAECGYNRSQRALHFHHLDPSEKSIWSEGRGNATVAEIDAHPERFVLLCANCHIELHDRADQAAKQWRDCARCGARFATNVSRLKKRRGLYCSRRCAYADRPAQAVGTERERLWKFVVKPSDGDGCWGWSGSMSSLVPYLNRHVDGKNIPTTAARISYEMHHGPIPAGKHVKRTCRSRQCVNPDHLALS